MAHRLFIFRRAHVLPVGTKISPKGKRLLTGLLERYKYLKPRPVAGFSSDAPAAGQTCSRIYGGKATILPSLHTFVLEDTAWLLSNSPPTSMDARAYGSMVLDEILSQSPADGDIVVVTHEVAPLVLAREYVERNGGMLLFNIAPTVKGGSFPGVGEGIMVSGSKYALLRNPPQRTGVSI